ncbi:filamentous hemagglutinin N-terminal domain-containing protein [Nostocaceae cyanobacterium CENA369]|uniref:Filamentous hemagglutinin N-terminal domain-containing protein n=1 Tax=Dendronalium phyllosphericum CENA369 TaxID=1725256 RepID=A0A8J7ILS0_9NOST|nr:filamentous hemagglutinin N-terminal domain-containing protein [Dendronalium phyllosphericum]MBH8578135.1 filamentous hemagglutinin N-terminal domain-containing protein [Dendronalium phyllosphericum CENA369]
MSRTTRYRQRWEWKLGIAIWLAMNGAIASSINCASAQITPDGTLPNKTSVTAIDDISIIEGGTQAGKNLFHSFEQFSVLSRHTAYFNNALDIQNIISRVTGKSVSNIDGLIGANGNANLFLINPNGIIFGPNAALNIGGLFLASTASSLNFSDNTKFSAITPQNTPLLTVSVPTGLQYGEAAKGILIQQGFLALDKSLALIGGDVDLDGAFLATKGSLNLGGIAAAGTVGLNVNGNNLRLNFPNDVARANISLINKATVATFANKGGSDIQVWGRNIKLQNGSQIATLTQGAESGGNLSVNASESVAVIGTSDDGQLSSRLFTTATEGTTGNAGDLTINTRQLLIQDRAQVSTGTLSSSQGGNLTINTSELLLKDGAQVTAGTFGDGKGGNLSVTANKVQLIGIYANSQDVSGLFTTIQGAGNGGNLTINTGELLVRDGAQVNTATFSSGKGGSLTITADKVQLIGISPDSQFASGLFASAAKDTTGNAGDLTIHTGELLIQGGAKVDTSTSGAGKGGDLTITADKVQLIGRSANQEFISNLKAEANPEATGKAGNLTINTGELLIQDGADVTAGTFGAGKGGDLTITADKVLLFNESADSLYSSLTVQADRGATADAGNLTINTGELLVRDGAQVTANTYGTGKGGNLSITASKVQLIGSSSNGQFASGLSVSTERSATGDAGELRINTGELLIQDGAQASAGTFSVGKGGNLTVIADKVQLIGRSTNDRPSSLAVQANRGSSGNAGELTINTGELLIQDGAQVSAATLSSGNGGNLTVTADKIQLIGSANNQYLTGLFAIAGQSATGNAGDLTINTGELLIQDGAEATVNSFGKGVAGSLGITANSLLLNNGKITAQTFSGNGGNLKLNLADFLLMRRSSEISTTAGTAQQGGDGGNIAINAPNGFIIAVPSENNDITANAYIGKGGTVKINAFGIYGIQFRDKENPQTSDITASSDFGLNGTVELNTPDIDPDSGLVELPIIPVDTELAQGCTAGGTVAKSEFNIIGRGGLPPNPGEALNTDAVQVDLITLNSEVAPKSPTASPTQNSIIEAQNWVIDAKGNVTLTANAPHTSSCQR